MSLLKRTRGWKLPLIAMIALTFAVFNVLGRKPAPAKEVLNPPPQADYVKTIAGIGVVEPKSEFISIGVELPGVVRTVSVKVGDNVKKGDLLFTLDTREIDAQISTLEAALSSAKVQEEDASAQFALVSAVDDKRAVAKDDYNRRKFAKALAHTRIEEIKAQLEQAKTTKERLNVKAPIDGRILEVEVRPGEYAQAGALAVPLIRMGDVSRLHVRTEIDEQHASHVLQESSAKGFIRGDTQQSIPLSFVRFEPYIRPKQNLAVAGQRVDTRVLQVVYALPENQEHIFAGQQMDVFIDTAKVEGQ